MARRKNAQDLRAFRSPGSLQFLELNGVGDGAFSSGSQVLEAGGIAPMPEALFNEVYEKYAVRMRGLALRITRNEADAEDALQDAFMRVFEKYGTFRGQSSLWTWIYRVTETSALMILKKKRSIARVNDATREAVSFKGGMRKNGTPEQALRQAQALKAVEDNVEALAPTLRGPINAYLREGLNNKDLSRRFNITLSAVKTRLHRARTFLRPRLRPYLKQGA